MLQSALITPYNDQYLEVQVKHQPELPPQLQQELCRFSVNFLHRMWRWIAWFPGRTSVPSPQVNPPLSVNSVWTSVFKNKHQSINLVYMLLKNLNKITGKYSQIMNRSEAISSIHSVCLYNRKRFHKLKYWLLISILQAFESLIKAPHTKAYCYLVFFYDTEKTNLRTAPLLMALSIQGDTSTLERRRYKLCPLHIITIEVRLKAWKNLPHSGHI